MIEKILKWLLNLLEEWQNRDSLRLFGSKRDPRWAQFRREIIFQRGYKCEATGKTENIELHHCKPFHKYPELELDPDNVILLERGVHFDIAHLCSWRSWNKDIKEDARKLREKIANRP